MFKIRVWLSGVVFLFSLSVYSQEFDLDQNICASASSQQRKETFISSYGLNDLYEKMDIILRLSQYMPLMDSSLIYAELTSNRSSYVESQENVKRFQSIILSLNNTSEVGVAVLLQEYSQELLFRVEEINLEIADISDAVEKYNKRDELVAEFKASLISKYTPILFNLIDSSLVLGVDEKSFLKDHSFSLVPNPPAYFWSDSAKNLHRYIWDTFYNSGLFEAPGGKLINSIFLFETIVNHDNPGLHLNLSYREVVNEKAVELDISLIFSPFENSIPIQVCDFNFLDGSGNCKKLNIDEWCELKGSLN